MNKQYNFSAYNSQEQKQRVAFRDLPTEIRRIYKPNVSTTRIVVNELLLVGIVWAFLAVPIGILEKAYLVSFWWMYICAFVTAAIFVGLFHWWCSDEVDRVKLFVERNGLVLVHDDFPFVIDQSPFRNRTGKYEMFLADVANDFSYFVATYCHWPHRGVGSRMKDYLIVGKKETSSAVSALSLEKGWTVIQQDGYTVAYKRKAFDYQKESDMKAAFEALKLL